MVTEQISIVIVESQPLLRTAFSAAFSAEGMQVLAEVADSRDALQTASHQAPDLILFSINDAAFTDLERITMMRQRLPNTQIIVLVTGEFHGQFQSALDYGAHLVLTKYTPRLELLTAIKEIARKRNHPVSVQVD